jgi:aminoglycoside phosphotransferase (APT) family kinase protein
VAILDWELVHLGDPLDDIAYILGAWRSAPPHNWLSHLLPEEEFFERYEQASGIKIDMQKLEFYNMLFKFKSLGIGATAAGAWNTAHELDLRIGVFAMTHYISTFALISELHNRHSAQEGT